MWDSYYIKTGYKHNGLNPISVEKRKQTSLKNYGVEYPMAAKEVQEKFKNTCRERYNVDFYMQNEDSKKRFKRTCIEKYGVDNPNKHSSVMTKRKLTNLERYNKEHFLQTEEFKDKSKKTYFNKTGYYHNMQNSISFNKNKMSAYKLKLYKFPSGRESFIQGYEPYALNLLLLTYDEKDIIVNSELMPEILVRVAKNN